eukprot:c21231_g3_i2.p1 GENE.c21231_g3_i2~~c21231_g3_i2.p1  ORF type:complete len:411 (+),score=168.36 c21231_g3_i2:49-1233(+)
MDSFVLNVVSARKVPRRDGILGLTGKSDPYVIVSVNSKEEGKDPLKFTWPYKETTTKPIWNSARDFGSLSADDTLKIELWDKDLVADDLLGTSIIPVKSFLEKPNLEIEIKSNYLFGCFRATALLTVELIRNTNTFPTKKKLFFVRHGESKWNKAQADMDVSAMLSETDHALDDEGVNQALGLEEKLSNPSTQFTKEENDFLSADIIFSSPLTRAAQTALIGLNPILQKKKIIHLKPNLREKRNFGGRDSSGKKIGNKVPKRILKSLSQFFILKGKMKDYQQVQFNTFEVNFKWWLDHKESNEEVESRLYEFLMQTRFIPEEKIIFVGHSHFFRELCKIHIHSSFESKDPNLTKNLQEKIVQNCGVVALEVDFADRDPRLIRDVKLLFGSNVKE